MSTRKSFASCKRMLIQLGASITGTPGQPASLSRIGSAVEQISKLVKEQGRQAIVVADVPSSSEQLYSNMFSQYGLKCQKAGADADLNSLLASGVIPIVHESEGSKADTVAANVAKSSTSELVVMLTDVDGVFTGPPKKKGSQVMTVFGDQEVQFGGDAKEGRNGMQDKVNAAVELVGSNINTIIANGHNPDVLQNIINGKTVGTLFSSEKQVGITPYEIAAKARRASRQLGALSGAQRTELLIRVADALLANSDALLAANAQDLDNAAKTNLDKHMLARLKLTASKIETLASGIKSLAAQGDPIGAVVASREVSPGLVLTQQSVPLGVLMVIFESRPDALPQVVSLGLRSGNPLILKGGTEAMNSNKKLLEVIHAAIAPELGPDCYQLVAGREDVANLLAMDKYIDLVIPRGSNDMVQHIQRSTKIPVMGHADGICHVFVDEKADVTKATEIAIDAKTDYPAACNAMETLLIHECHLANGNAASIVKAVSDAGVKLYAGPRAQKELGVDLEPTASLSTEYGSLEAMVEIVKDIDQAVDWIATYGSGHTECIVTEDEGVADKFLRAVDSACVFHNATTRFADGFRFGLGAEVGISTSRLHARGPVGVQGLLTYRWTLKSSDHHTLAQHNKGSWAYTHKEL